VDVPAAAALLSWFAERGRELPWRGEFPRDPYRVLVSEVMLQQTRVDRVVPGFARFLARFPTLASLAAAPADDAVEAFAGMGYYGRARRLHEVARAIVARGSWPRDAADLAALPGLGAYTSAALAAFAFGGVEPPVDGNVCRVAARVLAADLPGGSAELARRAAALARELHAAAPGPALFEALMELGATVCTPAAPRCGACPLGPWCRGQRDATAYPRPRRAAAQVALRWSALWLTRADGAVLLRRVPSGSLLAGLWLPPFAPVPAGGDPRSVAADLARSHGTVAAMAALPPVRHAITRHRIEVLPFAAESAATVREPSAEIAFRDPAAPGLPTSSLLEKLRAAAAAPRQRRLAELPDAAESP